MSRDNMGTGKVASTPPEGSCGVYVHVPFCRRRCPYCDFAFEVRPADPRFAAQVLLEMEARRGELPGAPITLSFGGGTPSALPVADLARIIDGARHILGLPVDAAEVSLELNPEDVRDDPELPRKLRAAGFTRASLGIQSFDDDVLKYLGRAHDGGDARLAVRASVDAGLRTGVDLIVGVPHEREPRLEQDIDEAVSLGATHVSAYILTVEPGTPLVQLIAQKKRAAVDDDAQAAAYEQIQQLLPARGLPQYEVSSYARPGEESVHNRLYWQGGPYLGVGPSAHSMRHLDDGRVLRRHTTARLDGWLPDPVHAAHEDEVLQPGHAFVESVAFGLRDLRQGVEVDALAVRHKLDAGAGARALVARVRAALDAAGDDVERTSDGRVRLTAQGARFADRVARAVLAAHEDQG